MKLVGVVAPTYKHFRDYVDDMVRKSPGSKVKRVGNEFAVDDVAYFYVNSIQTLQGRRGYKIVLTGPTHRMNRRFINMILDYEQASRFASED